MYANHIAGLFFSQRISLHTISPTVAPGRSHNLRKLFVEYHVSYGTDNGESATKTFPPLGQRTLVFL